MRLSVAVLALVAVHVGHVKPPGGTVVVVAVVVVTAAVVAGAAVVVVALPPGGGGGTHAVTARRARSPLVRAVTERGGRAGTKRPWCSRRRRGSARGRPSTRSWWENAPDRHPPCGHSHRAGGRRPRTGTPGTAGRRTGETGPRRIGQHMVHGRPGTVETMSERSLDGLRAPELAAAGAGRLDPRAPRRRDRAARSAPAVLHRHGDRARPWPGPPCRRWGRSSTPGCCRPWPTRSPTSTPGRRARSGCRPRPCWPCSTTSAAAWRPRRPARSSS